MTTTTTEIAITQESTALEQQARSFTERVSALHVTDAESFGRATDMLKGIATYIKRVGEVFDPIVESAHKAHKVAVAQRDGLLKPAQGAKRILGERVATWEQEQERRRRAEEEAAQREQERLEREERARAQAEEARLREAAETQRLEEAARLEQAGDTAAAERLIAAPLPTVSVAPAPVFAPRPISACPPKAEGVSMRSEWKAEVTDLAALVRAVAAGQQPITLLQVNQTALNGMARALKGALNVPGVRVVESRNTAVRA